MALLKILLDLQGNDFGVGGNIWGYLIPTFFNFRPEYRVIVDISVEAYVNDPIFCRLISGGSVVNRVTVCFSDGSHRGPACMGKNRKIFMAKRDQQLNDGIFLDLPSKKFDVIPQTTYFSGNFVCQGYSHNRFFIFFFGLTYGDSHVE